MLLNRKHLPRSFVRRWSTAFTISAGLLLLISLAPGISGLGHLGGALTGALVALLLHWQRFGPDPWRWLALLALLPLPWAGYAGIEYARRTNPAWLELQRLYLPSPPDGADLEELLEQIGKAAPAAWYPRAFAEATGSSLDAIYQLLELLYLDGLVEKGESDPDKGPGVVLTDKGVEVLRDPDALERLRQGQALDPEDLGGRVREVLRRPHRIFATWLLILANLGVFGYTTYLASQKGLVRKFLDPLSGITEDVVRLAIRSGAENAPLLIEGQWWRLLTASFVSLGALQLVLTLWILIGTCRRTEQLWGWPATLAIFLLAGFCGNCVQLAEVPAVEQQKEVLAYPVLGSWGAIYGLLGAEMAWLLLSRKHLPRAVLRSRRSSLLWRMFYLVLYGVVFFFSQDPVLKRLGWGMLCGELGGAIAGVLAGMLLYWHRFGPDPWRWFGLIGMFALPWFGLKLLDRARATDPVWFKLEDKEFDQKRVQERAAEILRNAQAWYKEHMGPLVRRDGDDWKDRDQKKVKEALQDLEPILQKMSQLRAKLSRARLLLRNAKLLSRADEVENSLKVPSQLLTLAEQLLRDRDQLTAEDKKELKRLIDEVDRLSEEGKKARGDAKPGAE